LHVSKKQWGEAAKVVLPHIPVVLAGADMPHVRNASFLHGGVERAIDGEEAVTVAA
jgi:hypothetical protein